MSEQYKLQFNTYTNSISEYAIRLSDGANVHRELNKEYVAWLEEGNEPLPAEGTE